MKQTKVIVITAILTLLTLGSVVYTSCRPDHCKNLNCQNGGTCNDGFCTCPTGYTGTYCQIGNVTNIALRNETFTTVSLTIGGINYSVDSGSVITFTGTYGDTLKVKGTTHGLYGLNVSIDSFKIFFPSRGTSTHDLDVSADYFFLMATNTNSTTPEVTTVYVNYKQIDSTLDVVTNPSPIRNNGNTYHIGYFRAHTNTKVRVEFTPTVFWSFSNFFGATLTKNQFYNAKLN